MNNENNINNMNCDLETGVCEAPMNQEPLANNKIDEVKLNNNLQLHYFTDPLCSACYVYDDILDEFTKENNDKFEYHIHMGGMVPEKKYLLNPSAGLSSYQDLADHWKEMGANFGKPINPSVWLDDPMESSYPPSIAFKAAELQDKDKAHEFMISLRKALFEEGLNIERDKVVYDKAEALGLDVDKMKKDVRGLAVKNFYDDLEFSQGLGVRSFPTLIFIKGDQGVQLRGVRTKANLETFLQEGLAL